jgi:G3E family GTPase
MENVKLLIVGGFLGAGKTTMIHSVAGRLKLKGKRIGLLTNDQAPDLVDTALLKNLKLDVEEVSGSCFCCNFEGFFESVMKVQSNSQAEVVLAEPVGSCTDLVSTIIGPFEKFAERHYRVAPLSVLADALKLKEILLNTKTLIHPSSDYIFLKQLEESDVIVISKIDIAERWELEEIKSRLVEKFPIQRVFLVSSETGEGIDEWLDFVLSESDIKRQRVEIDYDIYAEGEAVLGWLNWKLELKSDGAYWDMILKRIFSVLANRLDKLETGIGHVKILMENNERYSVGNLTGEGHTLTFRGEAGEGNEAKLTINARVHMEPAKLEKMVKDVLLSTLGRIEMNTMSFNCFSPAYPRPTYKFGEAGA